MIILKNMNNKLQFLTNDLLFIIIDIIIEDIMSSDIFNVNKKIEGLINLMKTSKKNYALVIKSLEMYITKNLECFKITGSYDNWIRFLDYTIGKNKLLEFKDINIIKKFNKLLDYNIYNQTKSTILETEFLYEKTFFCLLDKDTNFSSNKQKKLYEKFRKNSLLRTCSNNYYYMHYQRLKYFYIYEETYVSRKRNTKYELKVLIQQKERIHLGILTNKELKIIMKHFKLPCISSTKDYMVITILKKDNINYYN
jgi:hypothetical protein